MKNFNFKDNKMIIAICIIIIIIFFCVFFYTRSNLESEYNEINNYNILQNETNIDENEEDTKIFVHVTGAVKSEGIVKIKEEGRIADAVEAANGFSEDADISQINLAYKLEDGQKIYIPSINDEKVKEDEKVLEKEYVTDEAGDDIILEDEISTVKTKKDEKININTAMENELKEIPGVGESTAKKIIEYRKSNGKFKEIEDIKNVSGIGDSKFENMREKICVK
ncbi:MAG: helix-hairpin-helix domain-containing protein [Clostridia bacterium]